MTGAWSLEPGASFRSPDYTGGGLVNLVAELEQRLTGTALHPGLNAELAAQVPDADTFVLVLFDGLGDLQLEHEGALSLRSRRVGALDACFPATTMTNLATLATGRTPAEHGLLGYQLWLPEHDSVVNTIRWTTPGGVPVDTDTTGFLPRPNLAERLGAAGVETITLQPWSFEDTQASRLLYRGARFESWTSADDAVALATALAATPRRIVFLYVPHVDFAAHVVGQDSADYAEAVSIVDALWARLTARLPAGAVAVATADHGHIDIPLDRQIRIDRSDHEGRIFSGDVRALFVHGDGAPLADRYPATWVPRSEMEHWWGPGARHPSFEDRAPDGVLVADDGYALLHRHADERLIGQHGAPTDAELRVPLLVATGE